MMRCATALLWVVLMVIPAAGAATLSLVQAVDATLSHVPSMRSAIASRASSAEDEKLGRAWLLPYVVVNGSWKRQREDIVYYSLPAGFPLANEVNSVRSKYGITAYQPLFDVEKWSLFKQGQASAGIGDLSLRLARRQTMMAAATAWLDVMRADHRLAAARASEAAMIKLAEQAAASFEVGLESVNTSLAANSRRDLARAHRIRAEQVVNQAQAVLASLLGRSAQVQVTLDGAITPMPLADVTEQQWLDLANANEQVLLAEKGVALADAGELKALGGALPKLQLVAGWDKQRSSAGTFGTGSEIQSASIGVEVSMPLYAGGSTWSQRRKSEQEKLRADADLAEAQRSSRLAVRQAWLQWQSTGSELVAMKAALASAGSEQEAAHAGFDAGLRTLTEVLDAEDRLAGSRAGLADSVASHALSVLQLYAAVGDLDGDKVTQVQNWLIPEAR